MSDTSTGPNPGGIDEADSPMPGGAVVGEAGQVPAEPGDADIGRGADVTGQETVASSDEDADDEGAA